MQHKLRILSAVIAITGLAAVLSPDTFGLTEGQGDVIALTAGAAIVAILLTRVYLYYRASDEEPSRQD